MPRERAVDLEQPDWPHRLLRTASAPAVRLGTRDLKALRVFYKEGRFSNNRKSYKEEIASSFKTEHKSDYVYCCFSGQQPEHTNTPPCFSV